MKTRTSKLALATLMGVVCVAAVWIGIAYSRFISRKIYEDSTNNLQEIYGQVNRSFGAFAERNWGLLDGWGEYIALAGNKGSDDVDRFIAREQKYWGFSDFYFLSSDGSCMTPEGRERKVELDDSWKRLFEENEAVMEGEKLATGRGITVFAAPGPGGTYRDFNYDAIAVGYTNEDMANSLRVDAFSGMDRCFVIHSDGTVLLSTHSGGSVFENYLVYLKAVSDLDEEALTNLEKDWSAGVTGQTQCRIGGVSHYILYQSVGYQGYILLSAVPQSVVNASFLSVQNTTVAVLIVIFLLVGVLVVSLIITRSRRQFRKNWIELRYRDIMFDALSNSLDDIFLMLNIEGQRADYLSPNVERLLGIPLKAAMEDLRVMEKCAVNGDVFIPREELEAIPLHGSIYRECEYRHQATGERRWYRMTVYHTGVQEVEKYIIVMSDRTQERQMNQNLQEALTAARSANEAKSNFLSNMSHDIRTPMNAIVGFSVLLEKDADQADKVREYTRKIKASSQHLLSLINDVLDMSKIESGKTSLNVDCFDLSDVLSELNIILMPQAKAKRQTFETHVQGTPPKRLMGDKLRLNQILINLLSNAIKYTPDGGKIEFLVYVLSQPSPQYAKLRFVVRDNGIGMSEEFLEHVFAPFSREINSVTNKIQGTGLGMAITKNLVDLMGGIIQVESSLGQGSTFTVELSFNLPDQEPDQEKEQGQEQEQGQEAHSLPEGGEPKKEKADSCMAGRLFLVAEDNELNAEILTEMLDMEGAKCELAVNGQEALKMFEASKPGYYDMILMDVQMPVMNGYEAARAIRACGHPEAESIPIVAMTANTFAEDVRNALDAGMDGHLGKPIDMEAVRATVGRLLRKNTNASE